MTQLLCEHQVLGPHCQHTLLMFYSKWISCDKLSIYFPLPSHCRHFKGILDRIYFFLRKILTRQTVLKVIVYTSKGLLSCYRDWEKEKFLYYFCNLLFHVILAWGRGNQPDLDSKYYHKGCNFNPALAENCWTLEKRQVSDYRKLKHYLANAWCVVGRQ